MYFHSLKLNKVIQTIKGGEVFVDFISNDQKPSIGSLVYLSDSYFYETKWESITKYEYRNTIK